MRDKVTGQCPQATTFETHYDGSEDLKNISSLLSELEFVTTQDAINPGEVSSLPLLCATKSLRWQPRETVRPRSRSMNPSLYTTQFYLSGAGRSKIEAMAF